MINFLIPNLLCSLLGRIILYGRHLNKKKVHEILAAKYDNSFTQAGAMLLAQSVAGILLMGVSIALIATIYAALKR